MITKEEYEEAQNIVWDYEEQLKSNVVLDGVIKCDKPDWHNFLIQDWGECKYCKGTTEI